MPLTVRQLIRELKKFPPDSLVGVAHHDNEEDEVAAMPKCVETFDWEKSDDPKGNKGIRVIIRC